MRWTNFVDRIQHADQKDKEYHCRAFEPDRPLKTCDHKVGSVVSFSQANTLKGNGLLPQEDTDRRLMGLAGSLLDVCNVIILLDADICRHYSTPTDCRGTRLPKRKP